MCCLDPGKTRRTSNGLTPPQLHEQDPLAKQPSLSKGPSVVLFIIEQWALVFCQPMELFRKANHILSWKPEGICPLAGTRFLSTASAAPLCSSIQRCVYLQGTVSSSLGCVCECQLLSILSACVQCCTFSHPCNSQVESIPHQPCKEEAKYIYDLQVCLPLLYVIFHFLGGMI